MSAVDLGTAPLSRLFWRYVTPTVAAMLITGIYVNRLIGKLVRDRKIEVQRPYVRLLDRSGFESRIAAIDLAPAVDLSWAGRG